MNFTTKWATILAIPSAIMLAGCGGSGGGSDNDDNDNQSNSSDAKVFSVDSYKEYNEGSDLSGIWMLIASSEHNIGARRVTESLRSTVFVKETNSGSYSSLQVSDPMCSSAFLPYSYHDVSYSGNNVRIATMTTNFDLSVSSNSRMSGTLDFNQYCGEYCEDDKATRTVEMVKVAPLPIGNWYDNFEYASPLIGDITGIVQPDATSDAFEFDDKVDCFMHSKGDGGYEFYISPMFYMQSDVTTEYESIVVSTEANDLIASNRSGRLTYQAIPAHSYPYYGYLQSTGNFEMSVKGSSSVKINISADASNDASSDGAEIDINIDL